MSDMYSLSGSLLAENLKPEFSKIVFAVNRTL